MGANPADMFHVKHIAICVGFGAFWRSVPRGTLLPISLIMR